MTTIKSFENGFEYIEVKNSLSSAKIALQGAHIFEYKRESGEDILWLSSVSDFEYKKAIRGGVPICWPRFGVLDKSMPAHGFARTSLFELQNVEEISEDETEITFLLKDTEESCKIWNYNFELKVIFNIGNSLSIKLETKNLGKEEFLITQALHTYFSVSDIEDVSIKGLEKLSYVDTLSDIKEQQISSIQIDKEVDRVYMGEVKEIILKDKNREISIATKGSKSTVVWNPWIEKGSQMSGMKSEDYKEFVCIESANAFEDFKILKSGESFSLSLKLN
jgi:glucose-6-phosphate 1-epimerase